MARMSHTTKILADIFMTSLQCNDAQIYRYQYTLLQIIKYINFYRSLNCNRQVNMVFANVSSSRFHYLFISVAELKGPYSVFNFEGYKISFRELLMSLIFP